MFDLKGAIDRGEAVRFLAIEWREEWEFDHPSLLIEPVVRYSPNGTDLESLIEDAAIDVAIKGDRNEPIPADIDGATVKEFEWRGWDLATLKEQAELALNGVKVKLGTGHVKAVEVMVEFSVDDAGEITFNYQ